MTKNYLYGIHPVLARLEQAPTTIEQLWVSDSIQNNRLAQLLNLAKKHHLLITPVTRQELTRITGHDTHQGIVILCNESKQLAQSIEEILLTIPKPWFFLILDGIQDPHNLGACLRSANAAGVHAVIAPKDNSAPLNAAACKVACGATEYTPYITVTNLARTLKFLQSEGVWIIGTAHDAPHTIYQQDLTTSIAIILGAEEQGLRRLTREHCDYLVNIPMSGQVESLNVSVATGIILFETLRQRNTGGHKHVVG